MSVQQKDNSINLNIVITSDTHGFHRFVSIPQCDILIHCGDFTNNGDEKSVRNFGKWLNKQKAKHKIVVLGNNEREMNAHLPESEKWLTEECENIHLLLNTSVVIENIVFYGSLFKFRKPVHLDINENQVLVCVSHEPPYDIMDTMVVDHWTFNWKTFKGGNHKINSFVNSFHPKLVAFGHCHNCYGIITIKDTIYANASFVTEFGIPYKAPLQLTFDGTNFFYK
ncbi:ser/thr protein phosphatase family protein [Entamoeba histolytica HM-1:IMSS-B]|uniref:Ser/thr protein phosphatase family protein n=5 Tax=Entamoeba histolytica TaxID=5759 RepID=C4M6X4_ENTH1|nr:ser/thr protein phosphatase family protein [Entamoeba histolytica HM-1:IMSS]EMD46342.1 ser/thr protein phosphatase family protein [Entamoeba histolytica KU27]EMH73024.1 ser/thr protein phosphatase family protein [Entamoeba histolytica HM-1:IMSS-B]EMS11681.1 ser/thr protein phosphatase family protein [Entamoeba histolytica HM-3:IMSS]GAT97244.1 Ser Thr protein phosphatase family protein [Entamoeba histolytica]EAL45927.1 ser/thr protein phosphatase family protein [Entamoeba histolytica HM-1:IM|eukprot:XP_651316.1 ser/thr protein phosphatase family protein [Entamoeba histolytica HM-1:IMSS]